MTDARTPLDAVTSLRLAEFARACKAALRAVSLYPPAHPAIGTTLARLSELTVTLTAGGPFRMEVRPHAIVVNNAAPAKPDAAIGELAEVLRRQLIGSLTLNAGANADSWRTLLMLVSRPAEEVRADGGIASLWATAGGPSLEIVEIDYAEVLREKQGDEAIADRLISAALSGAQLELDESGMRMLLEIVGDPARLAGLMAALEKRTENTPGSVRIDAFVNLLRGLAEYVGRTNPAQLDQTLRQVGGVAGRLSAEAMLELLMRRGQPESMAGTVDVVNAMVHRLSDNTVAQFVSTSVISERGPTDRLAQAFQALVPDVDRQRQLLSLAHDEVAASEIGQEAAFQELWQKVESMLTSYSDKKFVSDEYAKELSGARARAVDVEEISDDPPERIAAWLETVSDGALRALDHLLLRDLLSIEQDAARWRDIADTVMGHAEDLVRVGYFDQALTLADAVATEGQRVPAREAAARAVLERLGRGAMIRHAAKLLRTADDLTYERLKRLAHRIGPAVIPTLAEALSAEQDARSRRRLRDILVEFGAAGRESVQQLMHAANWEVRRTAAFLLREFGGAEGLRELQPLLTDTEPLVQREAIQALILNGTDAASRILLQALTAASGRPRETLIAEMTAMRDERAAPLFSYLVRHIDRKAFANVYVTAIDALGSFGGPDAVEALKDALQHGDWFAPWRTRRTRAAAAAALRRIGTPAALAALRDASTRGRRGVRTAARTELKRLG
ncbi:MAG TPA: HEAT repeat domain-containing protein [Vicinamibacterales bacterium]|nr:HEAT repeat domain-containing protein [Vicinamibacterales bacterium]